MVKSTALFQEPFYKKATTDLVTLVNDIGKKTENGKTFQIIPNAIHSELTDRLTLIITQFKQGYSDLDTIISDRKAKIQQEFMAKTNEKGDATERLLARQDYNLRLDIMDYRELTEYVAALSDNELLTVYQVSTLEQTLTRRKMELAQYTELISKVRQYRDKNSIGKEYENNSEWLAVRQLEIDKRKFTSSNIWVNVSNDINLGELYKISTGFYPEQSEIEKGESYMPVSFTAIQKAIDLGIKEYAKEIGYKGYAVR
jgi:hypothetical protein